MYSELHARMGHLEKERVLQLTLELFPWLKIEDDINHFIIKLCSFVNRKKPNIYYVVLMKTIT